MSIILIVSLIIFFVVTMILFFKYKNLKKQVKNLYDVGTGRKGFYYYNYGFSYKCIIYIKELDRYDNGFSKIAIDEIESINGKNDVKKHAMENFITLKKTDTIEWLEEEMDIKTIRKEKLDKIKKSLKIL